MNLVCFPVARNSKRPLVRWKEYQHRRPTDEEQAEWTRRFPDANVGAVTGAISGIIVLDVDTRRNGAQAVQGHAVPPTRVIRTPSGGAHFYFQHPGTPVPCVPDLLPGVDLKGDGGYVLVPPSSINGRAYEVAVDEPPASAPRWLLDLLQQRASRNGAGRLDETELTVLLRGVPEGQRDATATRLAGHYLAKGLPEAEVRELLLAWNVRNRPPLDPGTISKCVASVARSEGRKRTTQAPVAFAAATILAPQAVRWTWAGRIPHGTFAVLAGMPGLGKSTVLAELVARLSRAQLEGAFAGNPVATIFATAEDSLTATVVPRLLAAGADLSRVHLPAQGTLLLPDHLAALAAWQQRTGAQVVVLDPLVAHLSGRVNSWRDQDIRRVLAPAVRWAEEADVSLVAVVHLNKSDSQDILSRVGGSIAIVAAARSLLVAAPDPQAYQPSTMVLVNPKNNLAPRAPTLRYRLEGRTVTAGDETIATSGIVWLGEAADVQPEDLLARPTAEERTERQEATDWLREMLKTGPRPSREVFVEAKRLGFSERTVWRAKKGLGVKAHNSGIGWEWSLP